MPLPIETLIARKGLPASESTERFVLGYVLVQPDSMSYLKDSLSEDDFASRANRIIWAALVELHRDGSGIDRVTLANKLDRDKTLEAVGGLNYVVDLDEGLPDLPAIDGYIRILHAKTRARKLITACYGAIQRAYSDSEDPLDIASWCETSIAALSATREQTSSLRLASDIIDEVGVEKFMAPAQKEPGAIPVPWQKLAWTVPYWRPGQLIIVGGRPGSGKSVFLSQCAQHCASLDIPTAFFSLEMSCSQILLRMCVGRAEVDGQKVTLGKLSDVERYRLQSAASDIHGSPIWMDDTSARTVPAIDRAVRQLAAKVPIGMVYIDYLQLIQSAGRRENRTVEVSEMTRGLKLMAMGLHMPVMAASQLSRGAATESSVGLHHLRESGGIENDADIVLLLDPKRKDAERNMVETVIHVAKHRGGPVAAERLFLNCGSTKFVEGWG